VIGILLSSITCPGMSATAIVESDRSMNKMQIKNRNVPRLFSLPDGGLGVSIKEKSLNSRHPE